MRGDEAKKVCPEIQLIQVPVAHGKADLKTYRDAGSEVSRMISTLGLLRYPGMLTFSNNELSTL